MLKRGEFLLPEPVPAQVLGVKEMGNGRFLCENVVFQCTTSYHVILNAVKDLSKTHRIG